MFLLSLHNYDFKWTIFKFTWQWEQQGNKFHHLCLNLGVVSSAPNLIPFFEVSGQLGIIVKKFGGVQNLFVHNFSIFWPYLMITSSWQICNLGWLRTKSAELVVL